MPKFLQVRELTDGERKEIERLIHARTASVRQAERARIVWLSSQGRRVRAIASEVRLGEATVRLWLTRFNAEGLAGLADRPRSGHPPTYTPEQVSAVIATALTRPDTLGLPFGSWTLDRLEAYLNEGKGIPIKRTRIDEVLLDEGLRWRSQESWFGERAAPAAEPSPDNGTGEPALDPAFAQKRGRSSRSTRRRRRTA